MFVWDMTAQSDLTSATLVSKVNNVSGEDAALLMRLLNVPLPDQRSVVSVAHSCTANMGNILVCKNNANAHVEPSALQCGAS